MKHEQYDVVVIGAGSGGLTAAVGFAKAGKRVLLVEKEEMGGECTNSGCIPSKALLHYAKEYHTATTVAGKTPRSEEIRSAAFSYVRNKIGEVLKEETPETFEAQGIEVVMGEAIFTSRSTISVNDSTCHFKKAVIATGSKPRHLIVSGLGETDILTNQNLFQIEALPERLLVIGSGPIGLEMSQACAYLGSAVTIATIDGELGTHEDPALRPLLTNTFQEAGVTVHTNAHLEKVRGKTAVFAIKKGDLVIKTVSIEFEKILVAIGREPVMPKGLETAGIESSAHGIVVNKNFRTTNPSVFATGDVAQRLQFTHTADDTSRQIITHVLSKGLLGVNKQKPVPKVTYTDPAVAQVGLSHEAAKKKFGEKNVFRIEVLLSQNDRAKTDTATTGMLVVVAKRLSGKVLGAHYFGPRAGEIISTFVLAMQEQVSLWTLQRTIFPYPTYSLVIKKAGDVFIATQLAHLKEDMVRLAITTLPKLLIAFAWIIALWQLYSYQTSHDMTVTETALMIFDFITMTIWGPLLYILAYTLRPLTFFPGTALTILSGVFFGFWPGVVLTIIAANFSAVVAYGVGRFFGSGLSLEESWIGKWVTALRQHTFSAILTMRLIFLPFDGVSYVAGILKTKFLPFVTATALGTLLGIATFVSIGASIDVAEFRERGFSTDVIDLNFVLLSATVFLVSLATSKLLRK